MAARRRRGEEIQQALGDCGQSASAELLAELSRAKNLLLRPERYAGTSTHSAAGLIAAVWRGSELELRRSNAFEFDDLLAFGVRLLAEHPHRLEWLRHRWPWIMVDEFQDTSHAQATLVDLAGPDGNLCVCGDDDQLIHGWRHADPRHILGFHERHPRAATIVLASNFRSRSEILQAAVNCVSHNDRRAAKALSATRGPGARCTLRGWSTSTRRPTGSPDGLPRRSPGARRRARSSLWPERGMRASRCSGRSRAPGSRTVCSAHSGLYERVEVRDALAYLTLVQNPPDVQALRRAIGSPRRGIGDATVARVVGAARRRHDGDLIAACTGGGEMAGTIARPARRGLIEFGAALEHVRSQLRAGRSLGHAVIATVTMAGGLVRHHQHTRDHSLSAERRADAERVLDDLRSLCRAAQRYEEQREHATLTGFLEHAAGLHAQELRPGEDRRITVSTIHRAKGTEAQLVVLLACEEQLLPSWRALSSPDPERLAEERRLFYVAATRAKDRLVITHAAERGGRAIGGPSRFLAEAALIGPAHALAA